MFDKVNFFKKIIIFYLIYFIFYIFLDAYLYPETWSDDTMGEDLLNKELIGVILGIVLLFIYIFTLYKLYKFKPIGKTLLIPVLVLLELCGYIFFVGNDYYSYSISYYLDYLEYFLLGMIVTFVYFTEINEKFDK